MPERLRRLAIRLLIRFSGWADGAVERLAAGKVERFPPSEPLTWEDIVQATAEWLEQKDART